MMNEFLRNVRYLLKPRRLVNLYRHIKINRIAKKSHSYVSIDTVFNNSKLIEHVWIGESCVLNNCIIGRYSYVGGGTRLLNVKIGSFCSIAGESVIGLGMHPIDMVSTYPGFYANNKPFTTFADDVYVKEYKRCEIGNDVWIGTKVTILPGVKIGNGAVIGTGAVVTKDVEPYSIVGGVPAKHIKYRFDSETIDKLNKSEWWNFESEYYYKNFKLFHNISAFIKNI